MKKKIGVMIYQSFSLQEITTLTSYLGAFEKLDYIASEDKEYLSEEGFRVLPTNTFSQTDIHDYRCIILPGTDPVPVIKDEKIIDFLRKGIGSDILFAAISSAPLILGKAGLLKDRKYTCGLYMEMLEYYDFMQKENYVPERVVEDGNIITAFGWYYQLFAKTVLTRLGYVVENERMIIPPVSFNPDDIVGHMDKESYLRFVESEETKE